MKTIKLFVLSFLLLPSAVLAIPTIHHWKTDNGACAYFIQSPAVPMLDISLLFRAGSYFDHGHPGLAALTNALFGQGADKLGAQSIAEGFNKVGAEFESNIGKDFASLHLRTVTTQDKLNKAINLLQLVTTQLNVSTKAFNRTKNQLITMIQADKQQPQTQTRQLFYQSLYQGTPYASPVKGSIDSIKQLSLSQVQKFYRRYYTAHNANVLLVGDLSEKQAHQIANQLTNGLPQGKKHAIHLNQKPVAKTQTVQHSFPANQTTIWLGNLSVSRFSSNRYALIIANQILGGSGLTSLLSKKVREDKGLTYSITSHFIPEFGLQPFVISLQTKNSSAAKAIQLTRKTLAQLVQQGPSKAQVQAAKEYLIGNFPLSISNNSQLSDALSFLVKYDFPLDYLKNYVKHIRQVTPQQVKQALQKAINPDHLLIVQVGGNSSKK